MYAPAKQVIMPSKQTHVWAEICRRQWGTTIKAKNNVATVKNVVTALKFESIIIKACNNTSSSRLFGPDSMVGMFKYIHWAS